jgi:glycerophosphoryl diester phosphodiesterase
MKVIGHRGARGLAPENTIEGLRKGLEHGVDELEFDLRVTKDGVVILHHDSYLTDPDGKRRRIDTHTYKQLKRHKKDLATLDEVLKQIGHPVRLYVEVKHGVRTAPVVKILKYYLGIGWKPSYFLIGSKSQKVLLAFHKALPQIEKIVIEPFSGVRAVRRARQVGARRLSMQQLWLWWGFIWMISRRGWLLYGYAINDPAKARRWERWGLAGVITDYPDKFEK